MIKIPARESKNKLSAMPSNRRSLVSLVVRMEMKENKQELVSNNAIMDVSSSMMVVSDLSEMCNDVITKRQKPKRLADVLRMCCDVLLGIL